MKTLTYILLATLSLTIGQIKADPTDSVSGTTNTTTNNNAKTTQMVIVSAEQLGFKDTAVIEWSAVLDSAAKHGYQVCPRQSGLDLYILLLNINMAGVPDCCPVYVGMNEISKNGNAGHYVYCLKTKGSTLDYKLGYAPVNNFNHKFVLLTGDMFVFQQVR